MPLRRLLAPAAVAVAACTTVPEGPALGGRFVDPLAGVATTLELGAPSEVGWTRTAALFCDLDGDGFDELVRGLAPHGPAESWSLREGLRRVDGPGELPVACLDLDADGRDDLVEVEERAVVVRWGPLTGAMGPVVRLGSDLIGPPSMVAFHDLDRDGWLDLVAEPTRCDPGTQPFIAFLRNGPRSFEEVDLWERAPHPNYYTLFVSDLGLDDLLLGSIGNPCFEGPHADGWMRRDADTPDARPHLGPFDPFGPDLFLRREQRPNALLADSAPMAAVVSDLDGNGTFDLAVTTDPVIALFSNPRGFPLVDRTRSPGIPVEHTPLGDVMVPWGVGAVDLDRDGRDDLVTAYGADNPQPDDQPDHHRVIVHWNAGDFTFAEFSSPPEGLDLAGQWMALSPGDFDRDGDADLAVGNQGGLPVVWRNELETGHQGFSFELRGHGSNELGIGARVTVTPDDGGDDQHLLVGAGASPHVVPDTIAFAGLRAAGSATIRIEWPSGFVQEVHGITAGHRHVFEEPAPFAVAPASRRAFADGHGLVSVFVTPHAVDGSRRPDAKVTVRLVAGTGTVESVSPGSRGWTAVVRAPTKPGFAVLELAVDDEPLKVRPRLTWLPPPQP